MSTTNRIIRITILGVLLIVGISLTVFGFNDSLISIRYQEDNSLNYKVYLKDNNYFDSNFLGENRTYITSLIDNISIQYRYNLNFSEKVSGEYTYYINALVYANKPNGEEGYYWSREYSLLSPKTLDVKDSKKVSIIENVSINYSEYNNILEQFKKDYSIQTDGVLKIQLVVESNVTGDKYTNEVKVPSNLSLSIPLLEKAVEASIDKSAVSNDNTLVMVDEMNKNVRLLCRYFGLAIILLVVILITEIFMLRRINRRNHLYESTLKKFVTSHDSIIATITNLPDVSEFNVIKVSSFDELLDVYNEVRMPINFYENSDRDKAIFMIINDKMCWEFVLNKDRMDRRFKSKNNR